MVDCAPLADADEPLAEALDEPEVFAGGATGSDVAGVDVPGSAGAGEVIRPLAIPTTAMRTAAPA